MANKGYHKEVNKSKIQKIAEFSMFDDTFMSAVFDGQIQETELLLKIVMGRNDIRVVYSKAQYYISNIYGHEVRLDILAKDHENRNYNIEVQRALAGASVQRARFNAALLDSTLLAKGKGYKELPERFTIFITEKDMFGMNLPSYHAENKITELDNAPLCDGGHIIYINGEYRNIHTPIGKLMHDFFCINADDILDPLLKERVRYLKETKGGNEAVCRLMDELITEELIAKAKKALAEGFSVDTVAKILELPIAVVRELEKQKIG